MPPGALQPHGRRRQGLPPVAGRHLRGRGQHRQPPRGLARPGIDAILREAWERGVVLTGLCAGSMCWFEGGVTSSFGRRLTALDDGLGFLPGSNCPHFAGRRDAYTDALRAGLRPGLGADDGVALHFMDRRLAAVVASRQDRRAYRVGVAGRRVIEAPLRPAALGGATPVRAATDAPPDADGVPAALAAVLQLVLRATSGGR